MQETYLLYDIFNFNFNFRQQFLSLLDPFTQFRNLISGCLYLFCFLEYYGLIVVFKTRQQYINKNKLTNNLTINM